MTASMFTKTERAEIAEEFGGGVPVTAAAASPRAVGGSAAPFCTAWPVTKAGLLELERLAKRPMVKFAIRQSIELGDIAFEARCSPPVNAGP